MLFVALLLLASNFITFIADSSLVQLGQSAESISFGSDTCVYCIFYHYSDYSHLPIDSFNVIIITLWLLYADGARLDDLYSPEPTWVHRYYIGKLNVAHRKASKLAKEQGESQKSLLNALSLAEEAFLDMHKSFWWEIVWLLFSGTYGLVTVLTTWFSPSSLESPGFPESWTTLGFGQMVALLLLFLPCFVAAEAFTGKVPISAVLERWVSRNTVTPANKYLDTPGKEPSQPLDPPEIPLKYGSRLYNHRSYILIFRIYVLLYSIYIIGLGLTLAMASFQTLVYVSIPLLADMLLYIAVSIHKSLEKSMSNRLHENGSWKLCSLKRNDPNAWKNLLGGSKTFVKLKVSKERSTLDNLLLDLRIHIARPPAKRMPPPVADKLVLCTGINAAAVKQLPDQVTILVTGETNPTVLTKAGGLYEGTLTGPAVLGKRIELQLDRGPDGQVPALEDVLFMMLLKPDFTQPSV
jgi:hypothetical protein